MPKGGRKRTQAEYEKEIIEAAKRIQKYQEALKSARQSETWFDFLTDIGVNSDILESKQGKDFWNDVARNITGKEPAVHPTARQVAEANSQVEQVRYKREFKGGRIGNVSYTVFRNKTTGRFVSAKDIISGNVIGF